MSLQAWFWVYDRPSGSQASGYRSCAPDHICIDGQRPPPDRPDIKPVCYCVSTENFVKIAQDGLVQDKEAKANQPLDVPAANSFAIAPVLADQTGTKALVAKSLSLEAQSYQMIGNVQSWGTLPRGTEKCVNCGRAVVQPIPVGTERVAVDVVLAAGTTAAAIYLEMVRS